MQDIAWIVSVIPMFATVVVFLFVFALSGRAAETAARTQERLRKFLFTGAILLGAPLTAFTLSDLPYRVPDNWSGSPKQTIDAVGQQWGWTLSKDKVTVGDSVEFHVTSLDVNHGFAIYGPSMRPIAQTQAMPGYTNVLRLRFQEPGTYKILCLEYCGVAHHAMAAEFQVLAQ